VQNLASQAAKRLRRKERESASYFYSIFSLILTFGSRDALDLVN
jgi:hypothetical protein